MGPIRLNNDNKDILRDYYINLYIIELKDKGIYEESMYQEIVKSVDIMIKRYQEHGDVKASFPKYMGGHNPLKKKYNLRLIGVTKKVELIKNGESRYIETLILYYKNLFKLNLSLQNNNLISKDKILEDGYKLIEKSINSYFDNNLDYNFVVYMTYRLNLFYFKNNIKTESHEKNIVIDNKNGNDEQRTMLYDKYYNLACKRIENTTKLPEEKFKLFLRKLVKIKVDKYFLGDEKKSTLRNYFEVFFPRLQGENEQIIVKYNLYYSDFYNESISILEEYVKEFMSEYIKENDIKDIKLICRLTSNSNKIAKDYLDKCIKSKRYIPFSMLMSAEANALINVKSINVGFEPQNVINGDTFDKENEKEILKEQLSGLKDIVKKKYTFYASEKNVDAKIDKDYNKIITNFVENIYKTKNVPHKYPSSYIATRLNQNIKTYANSTKRKFEKNKVERMLCFEYFNTINNYIEEKDFSEEEIELFFEYMGNAFENYVKNGTYKKELWLYLKELLDNYDSLVAKHIIEAKTYIDSDIKVLRHPKTK